MGAWAVEQLEQQAVMDQQRFQDSFAGDAMFLAQVWPRNPPKLRGSSAEAEPCLPHPGTCPGGQVPNQLLFMSILDN